jgi:transcriptional regulator with XRE-family HTH domain
VTSTLNLKRRHFYMLMRKEKKITLKEIGQHLGISGSAISQFENGKIQLKSDNKRAYEEYIDNK